MTNTPHELAEEFPDMAEALHKLKLTSTHFATLSDRYHDVNRAIHRAETDIAPTDDAHMTQMRKERMALKDEIAAMLRTIGAAS